MSICLAHESRSASSKPLDPHAGTERVPAVTRSSSRVRVDGVDVADQVGLLVLPGRVADARRASPSIRAVALDDGELVAVGDDRAGVVAVVDVERPGPAGRHVGRRAVVVGGVDAPRPRRGNSSASGSGGCGDPSTSGHDQPASSPARPCSTHQSAAPRSTVEARPERGCEHRPADRDVADRHHERHRQLELHADLERQRVGRIGQTDLGLEARPPGRLAACPPSSLVDGGTDIERRHDAELGASFGGPADADVDAEIWRDLGRAGRNDPSGTSSTSSNSSNSPEADARRSSVTAPCKPRSDSSDANSPSSSTSGVST